MRLGLFICGVPAAANLVWNTRDGDAPLTAEVRAARFFYLDRFVALAAGPAVYLYKYYVDRKVDDLNRHTNNSRCGRVPMPGAVQYTARVGPSLFCIRRNNKELPLALPLLMAHFPCKRQCKEL